MHTHRYRGAFTDQVHLILNIVIAAWRSCSQPATSRRGMKGNVCAIAIAGIQFMRYFMDYQIETGRIEGVLEYPAS